MPETVGQIGERELIRRLTPWVLTGNGAGAIGIGDDAAVLTNAPGEVSTILTTDLLIEGTHFLHNSETDWELVGRKAAGANLSDIAAMGARPTGILVSLGLPAALSVSSVEQLYSGMHSLARQHDVSIIGGDTTRAAAVTISITVCGSRSAGEAGCLRSEAKPGDYLYVSGNLGASRAGLDLILCPSYRDLMNPAEWRDLIVEHFSPAPRLALGQAVAGLYPRAAMIDISDGLANEARLLAEASQVKLEVHLDRLPVHSGAAQYWELREVDPAAFALFSGEEYELLMALPVAPDELIEDLKRSSVNCPVTCVGTVNFGSGVSLLLDGHPVDPPDDTFVHFP